MRKIAAMTATMKRNSVVNINSHTQCGALIQEHMEYKYGFKVYTAYIAEVKRILGLPMYPAVLSGKN